MSDWKKIFVFTKQERNGIAVLSGLIALLVAWLFLQPLFHHDHPVTVEIPKEYIQPTVAGLVPDQNIASPEDGNDRPDVASIAGTHSVYQQNELFLFNPNGLAEEDWVRLGLTPAQAKSIKNFEDKGGQFRSKEDVKKMYVISPEKYNELEPYIVIPASQDSITHREKKNNTTVYELNTADTSQLVKIGGIGPVFAARIVAYRNRLGGFYYKEQLLEVFGFDQAKYDQVQNSLKVDTTYISKININTAEASDLRKHPYITPVVANALVSYRKQHGAFRQVSDIRQCKVITEELYLKIAPYLTI